MGTETTAEIRGRCWHCGGPLGVLDFGRECACPACGKSTHCCQNCRHYAPGRANECMEPQVERVIDKARSNFCEWFEPSLDPRQSAAAPDAEALRSAAEALFKGDK